MLAAELNDLGIDVDCLPLLDLRFPGAHDIIGDRALGEGVETVTLMGRAVCEGLLEGGVLPVIKHIPGHGRAKADSHLELPHVDASRSVLGETDFAPFRDLRDMPLAMTAHIVYDDIDPAKPATTSKLVIQDVIRNDIGFDGLLMTDDLSMKALVGSFAQRTAESLEAGCDIVLHCNGDMREMEDIANAARPLDAEGFRRYQGALAMRRAPNAFDRHAAAAELESLLGETAPRG
jgi:beta-N-acetylhexosaminidase